MARPRMNISDEERRKRWRDAKARWAKRNPEKCGAWAKRNPGKQREATRRHKAAHPERVLLQHARRRAGKLGVLFNIDESDIVIPDFCPALGIVLVPGNKTEYENSPSLDRKVPELGYVKGNVSVISLRANRIKNNGTADEHRRIAAWMEQV